MELHLKKHFYFSFFASVNCFALIWKSVLPSKVQLCGGQTQLPYLLHICRTLHLGWILFCEITIGI